MVRREVVALLLAFALARSVFGANESAALFSFVAPEAKAVFVAGEFNHWSTTATPLRRDASGKWSATVSLPPGKHAYKFVVDGDWKVDEANPEQTQDGFGGMNSVITIGDPGVDPVVSEKDAVRRAAMRFFTASNFGELEKTADNFRRDRTRFSDGLWKLKEFYEGLKAKNEIGEEKDWRPWFEKMERWKEQFPESITQPVVLARGWLDYADEMHEKPADGSVDNARTVLETAAKSGARCPHWFYVMQSIARRQSWENDAYRALLAEAAAAEPTYYDYYASAAEFFLSRPHHDNDELERVAEEAATKFDSSEGMAAYARTVWFMENWFTNIFDETTVTWPKLRQGFLDMQKRYPDSRWNSNAFCRFAVQAKDRQTATLLFNRIGEHGDPNWGGYGRYEMARIWADPATPAWRVEPIRTFTDSSKSAVQSIAFSPDGRLLASGRENGEATLWDTASGEKVWSAQVADFAVMSVTFSADGKMLAAGAGEKFRATKPGVAKVWEVATKEEIASTSPKGVVWEVAFVPDGKTLALSGGQWEEQAESSLLDLSTKQLRALPWTAGHDHVLKGVAVSPDGKTLAADCYQSITVWSLSENRVLFDTRNLVKCFVLSLAFSPDGKTLATCGAPMRGHNDNEPGELTLWDTTTWKPRTPRAQTDAGGLAGIAWSPDGKWIAGGGYDQALHLWDASSMQSLAIYTGHDGMIWTVAFSPDGQTVASGSDDGAVKLWRLPK